MYDYFLKLLFYKSNLKKKTKSQHSKYYENFNFPSHKILSPTLFTNEFINQLFRESSASKRRVIINIILFVLVIVLNSYLSTHAKPVRHIKLFMSGFYQVPKFPKIVKKVLRSD